LSLPRGGRLRIGDHTAQRHHTSEHTYRNNSSISHSPTLQVMGCADG
jgi:hypothetical protein